MPTSLRDIERESIVTFIARMGKLGYFTGRVLDYGCGGKQPYREIIEKTADEYVGFDDVGHPGFVVGGEEVFRQNPLDEEWDAIVCTQVVQYIPLVRYGSDPEGSLQSTLRRMSLALMVRGGSLVMTYPTNWPEVEGEDLHRFTKAGMDRLLVEAGFEVVIHVPRGPFRARIDGFSLDEMFTGYGVVARPR